MKKLYTSFLLAFAIFQSANSFAQTKELWGMTSAGGQYSAGTIFKTDSTGNNQTLQQSFLIYEGANPFYNNLVQASDGKLYGMTSGGGANNLGVLFQYDTATSIYTKKLDFDGATNGSNPYGSLMQANDGKLYGMTQAGGANNMGVLFQFDPATSIYTKKIDFAGATNGSYPFGSLMQANDGKLYGMTYQGGANNMGVIFQYDPATSTYIKKLDFDGATNGNYPLGSLMQASDGKLYGMTWQGGANNMGVLFQYDTATSTSTKKLDFDGATNGRNPYGSLMQASDGKLYGMTPGGGANNLGVLFQYDTATSTYTKKLDFSGATNGSNPYGSLMQANDGKLYGMTSQGGVNSMGVLFQYDPATSISTKKLDFAGATNGTQPQGSLMQASDGKLYGMTYSGGANDLGVLFQYDPATSTSTKKLDFAWATNGDSPNGSLMQASDGKLYGMTLYGGANNLGVLFQYDTATSTYTKKLDFDGATNGGYPTGSLMQANDGKLYGMTAYGGANDMGVLFQYDPATSTYIKKLDFDWVTNGGNPFGSLMQANDGKLYGMTYDGGTNNLGVIFQYDPATSTSTTKLDFAGATNGGYPSGSLMQANDGKLYGMTSEGGANDMGVIFQYDPATSTSTKKIDFDGATNGRGPYGSLMQASDGNLYGMTQTGGTNNMGVLFQYNPATSTYTKKIDFAGATNGSHPFGSLMQASDGKLYGMTTDGGANDIGVLFQYDPATSTYTKKLNFNGANGSAPQHTNLIEIDAPTCIANYTTSYDSIQNIFDLIVNANSAAMAVSYLWDFGDGTTSTLATPTHTYTVDTLYNVCMKIYTSAGDSCTYCHVIGIDNSGNVIRNAGFTLNVHNTVASITQNFSSEQKIEVYPNPFTNQTTILFKEEQKNTTIKIMDVLGKEIRIINFTGKQLIIEKGEMENGIYFVQMIGENKNVVNKKIVVQ